jgi:hypothetical protein
MFWTAPEDRAADWADAKLEYSGVWVGLDGVRLRAHVDTYGFGLASSNRSDAWLVESQTRNFLISSVEEFVAARRGIPLPDVRGENLVYDNGEVRMMHLRPRTPYQR